MRKHQSAKKANKIFRRTAKTTKKINLPGYTMRGGKRL